MRISLITCWIFLLSSFSFPSHAIYIGTIKINHQEGKKQTTMEVKVFSDDLQNALKNEFQLAHLPPLSSICSDDEALLQSYFNKHLQVWINDQLVPFHLVDCTVVNDVHLLQFIYSDSTNWQDLKVKATFFMDLFPTQSNVLQVRYEKDSSSAPLSRFGRMTRGSEVLQISF